MTKKKSPTYTLEFKKSSVKLAVESDQPITQTAKELGVNTNTLYYWISKYTKPPGKKAESEGNMETELLRLKKENARLKQERDILKKAAAYFAGEIR